ncbi:MAG: efflux transporter outer membrane subunit, partial [Planctomycetes bacterium]|nr:efflux transporter outer membrane subunit [Planctomycetota bacterium]
APALKWQEFFADEKLQKLIETALKNNRDLRLAALNVERAQALYGIQRGELFPAFRLVGAGSKQSLPADLSNSGRRTTVEQYSANLAVLSWELDFFGRIRSLSDRALEEYLATEQARRSAQILLVSGVANAYLALAADREHLRLAETTLETQQAAYDLVKRRHDLGLATELDLYRAQTQVDAAQVELARFRQLVALDENALNLLLGSPSPSELLPSELGNATVLKEISPGVSSEALLRRPDVLQAENLLKATHANIGAARANFFPRISLTAAAGTASDDLSGLFKSGSGTWSFAPQILMPVFDARLRPGLKGAHVQREIALTQYEKAIQNAFREVADALALRGTVNQQLSAQESLVKAVSETHRLSNSRYDKGVDSYLSVLDAQRSLYAAQQGLITLRLAKLAHHIRLYAALGGGWEAADASPTTASASSTTEP